MTDALMYAYFNPSCVKAVGGGGGGGAGAHKKT